MNETAKEAARRLLAPILSKGYTPAGLYEYTNAKGEPIYYKARANPPAGTELRKEIRPLHINGSGWKIGEPPELRDTPKPLYRLHEIATADPVAPVFFVEGEPKADALLRLGLVSTTTGGAQSDERADFDPLAGRHVILWPDNDRPGMEHMQRVAAKLAALGCAVETLSIDALGLPKGGDVIDYLAAQPAATATDLAALPRLSNSAAASNGVRDRIGRAQSVESALEVEQPDPHRNLPRPDPACLYGLVGDVARAGSATTEANPYAIALNFLAYLGAAVGRGCYMPVGNTWHHGRLFTLHVGRSGRGRKGDAVSLIHRIDKAVRSKEPSLAPQVHGGGLSTREGLVLLIHDGYKEGKNEVPAIDDKRLWVVESEFANVLHQQKRDGNTLSAALRDAWDGKTIKPATKTNRIAATDPHISLSAAITPTELHDLLSKRELSNGFANRFLMIWAERDRIIAFPQATPQETVDALADRLIEVLLFAGADRPVDTDVQRIQMTAAAKGRYEQLYRDELNKDFGGNLVTTLLERRAATLLRLAMLFALSDLRRDVDRSHVDAAWAWIRYWSESVRYVFSSAEDEEHAACVTHAAGRIIEFLQGRDRATRTDITRECFGGHATKDQIDAAIDELLTEAPPRVRVDAVPRKEGKPGSPTKFYSLTAKSAKSADSVDSWASAGKVVDANSCEASELSPSTFRTVRTVRNPHDCPETRVNPHASHSSQSSHWDTEPPATVEVF